MYIMTMKTEKKTNGELYTMLTDWKLNNIRVSLLTKFVYMFSGDPVKIQKAFSSRYSLILKLCRN